ncbi:unnamed protein product [Urochloa humidicola]
MAGGSRSKKGSKKRRARRRRSQKRNPAGELTDDLLLEILTRVPYRSLCRFRCVSTRWRALISDPQNRGRLPQTLAGFFYPLPLPLGPRRCSLRSINAAWLRPCLEQLFFKLLRFQASFSPTQLQAESCP